MKTSTIIDASSDKVQVELSSGLLAKLITSGALPGSECKCLNSHAKKIVWQSLLTSSLTIQV
mgnify:CR=1 FL=1